MTDSTEIPSIEMRPNGPYLVKGMPAFRNSRGEEIKTEPLMFLCRCGGSANKPFCDGTHKRIGFSGANLRGAKPAHIRNYVGREITIHDNRTVCSHAGFCTQHSPNVFSTSSEPWINPDGGPAQQTIETVKMCPSGALSYSIGQILYRDQERAPCIHIMNNGPYTVVGGVQLSGDLAPASPEHYTLCRCGASKNKPFCDGSHFAAEFKDEVN
jgi:CDGSH-type Zn-finger protein/ferredoxin